MTQRQHGGFTLIEIATVLVIIGLIIGGVMVGRDLIEAATIRSTLTQIEKYETAAQTFKSKYGYLPGDLPASQAAQLGFIARGGGVGDGDGNGKIEGIGGSPWAIILGGETVFFWTDLSSAQLIDGSFSDSSDAAINLPTPSSSQFARYVPAAKTGHDGYIFAFNGLGDIPSVVLKTSNVVFEIAQPYDASSGQVGIIPALTVIEAQSIDSKIDDGMPWSGNIVAGMPGQVNGGGQLTGVENAIGTTSTYCISSVAPYPYNTPFPDSLSCNIILSTGF